MKKQEGIAPLIVILIIALAVGGSYVAVKQLNTEYCWPYCPNMTDADREEIKKSAEKVEAVSGNIYKNDKYGFEFKYPQDWKVEVANSDDPNIDYLILSSLKKLEEAERLGVQEEPFVIFIGHKKTGRSLLPWLNSVKAVHSGTMNANPAELEHLDVNESFRFKGWGRYENVGGDAYALRKGELNFFISPEDDGDAKVVQGILYSLKFID